MGWGKRLRRRLRKIRDEAIKVVKEVPQSGIDVVRGKKELDDAVRDSIRATLGVLESGVSTLADVDRLVQELTVKMVATIGGEKAKTVMADLNRLIRLPADPALAVAIVQSINKFVETGKLEYLNPIVIYALREITDTRDRLWEMARPVPSNVVSALPSEVSVLASGVRWMLESEIPGDLHLPARAVHHSGASAITLVDLIVYRRVPGHQEVEDLFLWTHELYHVHQYRQLGATTFTAKFISEEMGFRAAGQISNSMEMSSDLFACSHYPTGTPKYLPGNVCPPTTREAHVSTVVDEADNDETAPEAWLANPT